MTLRQPTICGDLVRAIAGDRGDRCCTLTRQRIGRDRARDALGGGIERATERDVEQVLRGLQGDPDAPPIQSSIVQAAQLVEQLRVWLRWDDGLREAVIDLVFGAVHQAERFGDGTGKFKRRFAVDVVTRMLEENVSGVDIPQVVHEMLTPFVGIFVDFAVALLNEHQAWPPIERVRLPLLYGNQGVGAVLVKIGLAVWRVWRALVTLVRKPSRYERHVRSATAHLAAERTAIDGILPRDRLVTIAEESLTIVDQLGVVIAPQVKTIDALYRLTIDVVGDDDDRRREVVVIAVRVLMKEAYGDSPFLGHLIDGPLGGFVIEELVRATGHFIKRLGIEPVRALTAPAQLAIGGPS